MCVDGHDDTENTVRQLSFRAISRIGSRPRIHEDLGRRVRTSEMDELIRDVGMERSRCKETTKSFKIPDVPIFLTGATILVVAAGRNVQLHPSLAFPRDRFDELRSGSYTRRDVRGACRSVSEQRERSSRHGPAGFFGSGAFCPCHGSKPHTFEPCPCLM